jgi:oligopeptide transport system substrate-binding protein
MTWEKEDQPVQVHRNKMRVSAVLLALALGATACGGGEEEPAAEGGGEAAPTGGTFSLSVSDPENPLIPSNTTESEGAQVLEPLFTGLVTYNPETAELEYEGVAESIESEDSKTWTINLKDGWTFHDGTPVDADSFINAWNFAANSNNAQGASYFFSNVEGYDEVQGVDGAPVPAGKTLTGLKKIDDQTIEVTLNEPFRQYPLTLGYTAFAPLPDAFFGEDGEPGTADDAAGQEAFGKKPIGNGPFMAEEDFVPGQGFTLTRFEDYSGEKAKADNVEFKVIPDINTAYTSVQAGELDIAKDLPPEAITTAPDEFGERYIERPSSVFTYVGFPTYDPRFDDPKVRRAFSMAIDREAITEAIFNGTRVPAKSVISPVVDGHREDACEACEYQPDEAKALLAETDFDTSQPVDLWFNAGAGHDEWMQAVGNNLRDNLGVEYKLQGGLQFAEYLPKGDAKGFTGPFRLGWAMDYPSPQNYLEPLYSTSALPPNGSNASFYSNPEFDELVKKGNSAETNEEAIEFYHQAEDALLEDMPVAPMFYGLEQAVHSENVSNVSVDAFGHVQTADVTVNQ